MYSEDTTFIADGGSTDDRRVPSITQLSNGNVVVTWQSTNGDGDSTSVRAAILTPDGARVGVEFQVNTLTVAGQNDPFVVALPSGGFMIVWTSGAFDFNTGSQVQAQIFSAAGVPVGGEFTLNSTAPGSQGSPVVEVLNDGRFVAVFESSTDTGSGRVLRARLFDASGTALGPDFVVETTPNPAIGTNRTYTFTGAHVANLAGGGFVISWTENRQIVGPGELPPGHTERDAKARVYGADGLPIGNEFLLSIGDATKTKDPDVVALSSGGFIAVWQVGSSQGLTARIEARIFDAAGSPAGAEFQLVAGLDLVRVTPLLQGGFLATLFDGRSGHVQYYLQAYDEAGVAVGMRLPIDWSPSLTDDSVVALADGRLLDASAGDHIILHRLVPPTELTGGPGNDIFIVKNPGDIIHEAAGQGYDVAYTMHDYQLGADASVEGLVALDANGTAALQLTGNGLANYLLGNAGANRLDGGAGADAMEGRGGNDIYVVDNVGDVVVEYAGQGYDVIYTSVSYALNDAYEVEGLVPYDFNGTTPLSLTGNSIANYLIGNAGDNRLDGGAGADAMEGRAGNDIYVVDNVGDVVIEASGQGYDVIYTKVSYTLAAGQEVEGLVAFDAAGTAPLALTGNSVANYLLGNAGDNQLNGGVGADILEGRGGNDIYIVDNAADLIVEYAGQGYDVVYTTVSYTLSDSAEVEGLVMLPYNGVNTITLTGNSLANYIIGHDGANVLNGGAGNDALEGRGGADTFVFANALGPNNVDYVVDFVHGTDKIALDDAIFGAGIGAPGAFNANAFVVGTQAGDADDRIIYNQATGQLFFDADGNGNGAAVLFATLNGAPTLTASDFQVI